MLFYWLISPSQAQTKKQQRPASELRTQSHILNTNEHFAVIEIPTGARSITRCVTYSNLETHTSTMSCEWDASQNFPPIAEP